MQDSLPFVINCFIMNLHPCMLYAALAFFCFISSPPAMAQCGPPSSLWLHTTQTAQSLTFNWSAVSGVNGYQFRYWSAGTPDDKTIVEQPGAAPFALTGLKKNTQYSVQIRSVCSNGSFSNWSNAITYLTGNSNGSCSAATGIAATASGTGLSVSWTSSGPHCIRYRAGDSGDWFIPPGGLSVAAAPFSINNLSAGAYQVQVKRLCSSNSSDFTGVSISTENTATASCLANKNYGKNLSAEDLLQINSAFNTASPYTFADMIGVNDGGLVFRSFLNAASNPITALTTQYRNFHTIDEDFDGSIGLYAQNIKPKDTQPEGTPSNTAHNRNYYLLYHNIHGFSNITGAIELLQYSPQTWKDKIYLESDWSAAGPAGIRSSFENYTKKFIDEFAPANGTPAQVLVSNFQVGNELWDYPVKTDYHNLLTGARNAFIQKYGPKSAGGWKMKFVIGAFQAFRDNNCSGTARNVSNCGSSLQRHDFVGDYLDVSDCNILKDVDAIDCHPYSFLPGTTTWTYPENPVSEAWQIRNLAAWLRANQNASTGILNDARLWSSEYGFDSNPVSGVGEQTQAAYLIRGLLLHSRFHFEKVFFYNAFDQSRPTDGSYSTLYYSSGFWRQGTQPANSSWPSPLPQHGATPKPSWYSMLDLKSRFGQHVFYKALVEDAEANVWIIARPDGTEPYLVFWAPKATTDGNVNTNINLNKSIDWSAVLTGNYKISTGTGQNFTGDTNPGQTFTAASGSACGNTIITTIRRNPAFIALVECAACSNVTQAGSIIEPTPGSGASPFDPGVIASDFPASGGTGGSSLYQWQSSAFNTDFVDIPGANALSYDPPAITQSTYFRRCARRSTCSDFVYSPSVVISVTSACPQMIAFRRLLNNNNGCNTGNDFYYEVIVTNIGASDQVTISGLPVNGLSISSSSLNGGAFNTQTFNANLQYVSSSSFKWLVSPANGSTQTLRLYYCWANAYPNPVSVSTATSLCSGQVRTCTSSSTLTGNFTEERDADGTQGQPFDFQVQPNPGSEQFQIIYAGDPAPAGTLHIWNTAGQRILSVVLENLEPGQVHTVDTGNWPAGLYFLCLQVGGEARYGNWGKYER